MTSPCSRGELVDDVEAAAIRSGLSTTMVATGNLAAQLNQLVAVRFMVAVETPDAAQRGGAAGDTGIEQPPDKCPVDGRAVVQASASEV